MGIGHHGDPLMNAAFPVAPGSRQGQDRALSLPLCILGPTV